MSTTAPFAPKTSGLAIASLVCGLVFCMPCLNIVAIVLGFVALSSIAKSNGMQVGSGFAKAGIGLGIATLLLQIIGLIIAITSGMQFGEVLRQQQVSTNKAQQIVLAAVIHEQTIGNFPHAGGTKESPLPKLSWRVHLLPHLEHTQLFERFKLDEPWNSPHNQKLITEMPPVYHAPFSKLPRESGKTCFQFAIGPGTLFDSPSPPRLSGILDGSSNTALLVVSDDAHAVTWTAPEDYESFRAPAGLVRLHDRTPLGMFDGSVHMRNLLSTSSDDWKAIFSARGGEVFPYD